MTTPLAADMTLRDYLAAQHLVRIARTRFNATVDYDDTKEAYRVADLMLRARAETQRPRIHEEDDTDGGE